MSLPSIAQRSVADLGGPTSVLVRQRNEHVRLNALLEDLGRTQGDGPAGRSAVAVAVGLLAFGAAAVVLGRRAA